MLELRRLCKSYGDHVVLDDINLAIGDGQIVSILGPSGGGKTTLLNALLGITEVTSGQVLWDGEDFTDVPMERRGFNIVFQDYALFPNLNARENIVYGLRNNPGISTDAEVAELIELLGLEEHLDKRISQLSGGQRQRVALYPGKLTEERTFRIGAIGEFYEADILNVTDAIADFLAERA